MNELVELEEVPVDIARDGIAWKQGDESNEKYPTDIKLGTKFF